MQGVPHRRFGVGTDQGKAGLVEESFFDCIAGIAQ